MASSTHARMRLAGIGAQLFLATALAVALGLSAGTGNYLVIGLMLGGAAVMLSALNWRRHLIPLIFAYVCVEGFVSLLFRQYRVSLLLKDFLIIIAYMSFMAEVVANQRFVFFRGILVPMAVLGLLGIAEIFNPALAEKAGARGVLVGIVGFKILCFYMPLVFLGYECFSSRDELKRFLHYVLLLSIPVGLMAAWQYIEGPTALTRFGPGFQIALVNTPGSTYGEYLRAIGTFASPGMLAHFTSCIIVIGVICLGITSRPRDKWLTMFCLLLACVTLLASGTRGGFLGTAMIVGAIILILGGARHLAGSVVIAVAAIAIVAFFLGQAVLGRLETLLEPGIYLSRLRTPILGTAEALGKAPLGWGLGYASVGARHVMPDGQPIILVENYISKLAYEMGWFGLITFIWLMAAALFQGLRSYRSCADMESRWITGCLAIFVTGLLMLSFSSTALDKIPLNVYFWFFLGVMLKVPAMQATPPAKGSPVTAPGPPGGSAALPRDLRPGL